MADFKRIIAGKIAKSRGEEFENLLMSTARRQGFSVVRIPDGCKQVSHIKLIRVKSPFDFIIVKQPNIAIFADTKSIKAKNFNFGSISDHQLDALIALENAGFNAGYIVYFQIHNAIVYFSAHVLNSIGKRQSLSPANGILLGHKLDFDLRLITEVDDTASLTT